MIYRVNWQWSVAGELEGVCTQHVTDGLDWQPTGGNVGIVASEVNDNLTAEFRAMLAVNGKLDSVRVVTVPDPNDSGQVPVAAEIVVDAAGTRSISNDDLPPRIGGLIHWRTGYTPRYARGRMFTPPLESSAQFLDNELNPASTAHLAHVAFANKVLDGNGFGPGSVYGGSWGAEGLAFVVYSPTRHLANTAPFAFLINDAVVSRRAGYLSSRDK